MGKITSQVIGRNITIDISERVYTNKNYLRLSNKPSINGVELSGNKTSTELNILSNNPNEYENVSMKSANKADFLILTNGNQTPKKMVLREISSHLTYTADEIPEDLEVGNYIFLLKENNNGSN